MDEFTRFNLWEGTFWILLGLISYAVKMKAPKKYQALALFSTLVFTLFGISDYVEIRMGGFLYPLVWWLLAWKAVCVVGMLVIVIWYMRLRLRS